VASHALPPQPARPTATATAAPVKKVAPPAAAPALPKVNIPAAEKGRIVHTVIMVSIPESELRGAVYK